MSQVLQTFFNRLLCRFKNTKGYIYIKSFISIKRNKMECVTSLLNGMRPSSWLQKNMRRRRACVTIPLNNDATTVEATLSKHGGGDLMGEVFFHVTFSEDFDENPFEVLERVEHIVGGEVIEVYGGRSLEAIATFDPLARPSVLGKTTVLPLRLCNQPNQEAQVRLTTPERLLRKIVERSLHVDTATLDAELRMHHPKKTSADAELRVPPDGVVELNMWSMWLCGTEEVHDLIIEVFPGSVEEPVSAISVVVGENEERLRLDAVTASRVVPRHRYGIDAFDKKRYLYYIPFDLADKTDRATARLRIEFADAARGRDVELHFTARTSSNTLKIRAPALQRKKIFGIPAFFTPDECDKLRLHVLDRKMSHTHALCRAQKDDDGVIALFRNALTRVGRDDISVVPDSQVSFGVYMGSFGVYTDSGGQGLKTCMDVPSCDGNALVMVYLNDVPVGACGRNLFYDSETAEEPSAVFAPVRGDAFVFELGFSHKAEPVAANHFKVMVSCEVRVR